MNVMFSELNLVEWWRPLIEIAVFSVLIYYSFLALKGTRTYQVLKGITILLIVFVLAKYLELTVITFILGKIFGMAAIVVVVLFQPEIRRAFAVIGRTHFHGAADNSINIIDVLIESVSILKEKYIGALIVILRQESLKAYIDTGVSMDSKISVETLVTIFTNRTPLHDGAVIIDGQRIVAAACLLPLSQRSGFSRSLGTRHRAAIGITEETDAMVLVVSEETGHISIASKGKLDMDVDLGTLRKFLTDIFVREEKTEKKFLPGIMKKYFSAGKS